MSDKPPSKAQLDECARLGLTVKPGMTSRQVWQLVQDALKRPDVKARYDALLAEKAAIAEAADREEFGDALVDERKKWEALCDGGPYLVVFKKGATVEADLLEFDQASIEGEKKPFVKVEAMRPKVYRNPHDSSPHFDFERAVSLKPAQILAVEKVPVAIDMFDLDAFDRWQRKAQELAAKYQ